jgi:hypothetical protein
MRSTTEKTALDWMQEQEAMQETIRDLTQRVHERGVICEAQRRELDRANGIIDGLVESLRAISRR